MRSNLLKTLAFLALVLAAFFLYPRLSQWGELPSEASLNAVSPAFSSEEQERFARAEVFNQTLSFLEKNYYDTDGMNPPELLKEALIGLSRAIPEVVVDFPKNSSRITVQISGKKKRFKVPPLKKITDLGPIMREIFTFVAPHYQGEVKLEDVEFITVNTMLKDLDPHSALLPPKIFEEFKTQTEGEFGGIGIVIGLKDGELTVISPLPNTPAGRAGLRPKDNIVQIDDEATVNMDLTEAVERLRGKIGTSVTIIVDREGSPSPLEFTLTRDNIIIESVQAKLLKNPKGDVGVLKVKSFQEETLGEMKRHLSKMKAQTKNFKGLILDLRNNPGGLLNQAVDIADMFLKDGTIVLTVGAQNQTLEINQAHRSDADETYPLVVLVNEGSASASEIVAGALKNNNRAPVLGKTTFGKGSVQSIYGLKSGAALKMTVAQYLTPGRASIQSVGITPDIKLLPVKVNAKQVDVLESETFGEKDLIKHLESDLTKKQESLYTLEYYQAQEKELDTPESTYLTEINPEEDFELRFAQKIVLNTQGEDRKALLTSAKNLLDEEKVQQSTQVAQALQGIGVDWSQTPVKNGKPAAAVSFNIISSTPQAMQAGEEAKLELTVRNVGDAPFYRLIASTESESYLLKNREFIFGKVNPGESKSWQVPLEIPASALSREDQVTFKFQEANGWAPEPFQSVVRTAPVARPQYAYQMEVHEDGQWGSKGDGDFQLERGERVSLRLQVENEGRGPSKKTQVNLKNLDGKGIFLNQGRVKLNALSPGEKKEALLKFTVSSKFPKDQVELELTIQDDDSQELFRDKLVFPVGSTKVAESQAPVKSGPRLTLSNIPYPTKTKSAKLNVSGTVSDTSGLKDLSVFVGERKAYLQSFEQEDPHQSIQESNFAAVVSLEEKENNLITILARDQTNLTTRKSFYIYKE